MLDEIRESFELLDDWEERYRYVIELGRGLEPLPEAARTDINKVRGCTSQVWLETNVERNGGEPRLTFRGESDAHIVRGLVAILIALYSGRSPREILALDPDKLFGGIGLREHLTPQRSNGLSALVERVRRDARTVLETA